jgi:hypothetical protein
MKASGHGRRHAVSPRHVRGRPDCPIISGVLIRNQETGRVLPPAPEFGRDGRWPPIATGWLPLRWELFETETRTLDSYMAYLFFTLHRSRDPLLTEETQSSSLIYEPSFPDYSLIAKITWRHIDIDIRSNGASLAACSLQGTAQTRALCTMAA